MKLMECVPNFSEGRRPEVIDAIAAAIAAVPGVKLLGRESDVDHHRSVLTFAGEPEAVAEAGFRAVREAKERIDLRTHAGVHPRIGATDVLPFVAVEDMTIEECAALATETGRRIWEELGIPVYLYEASARRVDRRRLEVIRRGNFEGLRDAVQTDPDRLPDFGEARLHPSAGATVVGARRFLIAYNINLASGDLALAKEIARRIRTSNGGLQCVKAMGVPLHSRGMVQVSMNLTDYETTPVHLVFEAVRDLAAQAGVQIAESELIGFIPRGAVEMTAAHFLRCPRIGGAAVLENALARS